MGESFPGRYRVSPTGQPSWRLTASPARHSALEIAQHCALPAGITLHTEVLVSTSRAVPRQLLRRLTTAAHLPLLRIQGPFLSRDRGPATSSAHGQTGFNLVCDSREVPAAKAAAQRDPGWRAGYQLSQGALQHPQGASAPRRGARPRCCATSGCATGVSQMLATQASWL